MAILNKVKGALFIVWLISLISYPLFFGVIVTGPQETTYNYEVKAQQVMDVDRVEDSDVTQLENLSTDEQRLLYDAFKKTDHFMGSSQVTLSYQDERLETFNQWKTIESDGVVLLVAVNEYSKQTLDTDKLSWYQWMPFWAVIYNIFGWIVIMFQPPV